MELLTKVPKYSEGVSISRCSLGGKMLGEEVKVSIIQIMVSSTEEEFLPEM